MPYLNWKDRASDALAAEVREHATRGKELVLRLNRASASELAAALEPALTVEAGAEISLGSAVELRLDLPREWIVFWKLREGETRLLLAHPQEDEWVTTVALGRADGARFLETLKEISRRGGALALGGLYPVASLSNVEVSIEVA